MAQMFSKEFSFILSTVKIWSSIKDPRMTDIFHIGWPPPKYTYFCEYHGKNYKSFFDLDNFIKCNQLHLYHGAPTSNELFITAYKSISLYTCFLVQCKHQHFFSQQTKNPSKEDYFSTVPKMQFFMLKFFENMHAFSYSMPPPQYPASCLLPLKLKFETEGSK